MQALRVPRNGVTDLTFSPDGDMLAGIGEHAVLCWTRGRGWEQSGLRHQGHITGIAFHPNGRTLAYAAINQFTRVSSHPEQFTGIRLYPLGDPPEFRPEVLPFHPREGRTDPEQRLRGIAFAPDGRTLFSCHLAPRLFRAPRVMVHQWAFGATAGVAWNPVTETRHTETAATNGTLMFGSSALVLAGAWGLALCPLGSDAGPAVAPALRDRTAVAVAPACRLIAAAGPRQVSLWRPDDPNSEAVVPVPSVAAVALAPSGEALATGHADGTVALWDPSRAERRCAFDFGIGPVQSLAYAPDGFTLAAAGRKGLVVFDTE